MPHCKARCRWAWTIQVGRRALQTTLQVQLSFTSVFEVHFHERRIQRPIGHALFVAEIHPIDGPVVRHRRICVSRVLDEVDAHLFRFIAWHRHDVWHRRLKRWRVVNDDRDFAFNGATDHFQIQGLCPLVNVVLRHFECQRNPIPHRHCRRRGNPQESSSKVAPNLALQSNRREKETEKTPHKAG